MNRPAGSARLREWFVPARGSSRMRAWVGLLFLPYTAMVLSYTVMGALLAPAPDWARVAAVVAIYFLGLGIGAHALDALGSRRVKPWGELLGRRELLLVTALAFTLAYAIGGYYVLRYGLVLFALIALVEGFFALAYNLEWFRGRFHTDAWFAVSWGALPVLAGYTLQTNALRPSVLLLALAAALFSLVQIRASRPYKALRRGETPPRPAAQTLEGVLRAVSAGVITLGGALLLAAQGR
ncbi:hypothetical protein HUS23_14325 [Ectothiorhodospiraceae bacterium 2226]|nr:hypothetical protein HUS23_14325 [Ectothiorhodospiraceae bacterium 2226]